MCASSYYFLVVNDLRSYFLFHFICTHSFTIVLDNLS